MRHTGAFYVDPIRTIADLGSSSSLQWNSSTHEISVSSTKTFVIDHPIDENKYLVHACLEGPEAGVYYRGTGVIEDGEAQILLPKYVNHVAEDFTVQITPVGLPVRTLVSSKIQDCKFTVYGEPGEFFWTVFGRRQEIEVEPSKECSNVKGDGPYKYISN